MSKLIHEAFELTQSLAGPPALLAVMVAAIIWAARILRRPAGLRLTVRGMMFAVVLIGSWLGAARWWAVHNFATVYASGYSESQFRRVRIGMTPGEVNSILGQPLRKGSTSQCWGHDESWIYSEPPPPGTIGDNYWRRWVLFNYGKVTAIVDDYYED